MLLQVRARAEAGWDQMYIDRIEGMRGKIKDVLVGADVGMPNGVGMGPTKSGHTCCFIEVFMSFSR